jgi:hypothetical protein
VVVQTEEQRPAFNRPAGGLFWWGVWDSVQALMRTVLVVVFYIVFDYPAQLLFGKNNEMVQTFLTQGTDKTFCVCVQVWRVGSYPNAFDAILFIGKIAQFPGIVVDEV